MISPGDTFYYGTHDMNSCCAVHLIIALNVVGDKKIVTTLQICPTKDLKFYSCEFYEGYTYNDCYNKKYRRDVMTWRRLT